MRIKANIEYEITVQFSGVNLTKVSEAIDSGAEARSCSAIHPESDVHHPPNGQHELFDKKS